MEGRLLHLASISFDARVGQQVDAVYPPFPEPEGEADWKGDLAFAAIPDTADKYVSSSIRFTLPAPQLSAGFVFGLSILKAKPAGDLGDTGAVRLRNQVYRGIVAIFEIPLFGELEQKMNNTLSENFETLDEQKLEVFYNEWKEEKTVKYSGIEYSLLKGYLQEKVLTVLKALTLKKRVLVYDENAELASKIVIALGSLLPGFMYREEFALAYLDANQRAFAFCPHVSLKFLGRVNEQGAALMGACNQIMLENPVMKFDMIVDCRTMPAEIRCRGDAGLSKLGDLESAWWKSVDAYNNEDPDKTARYIRKKCKSWIRSVICSILRVRHLKEVPFYARRYLDWENPYQFGEAFINSLLETPELQLIMSEMTEDQFQPIEDALLKKKQTLMEQFHAFWT